MPVGCVLGAPGFPGRRTLIAGQLLEGLPTLEGEEAPRIPVLNCARCSRDDPEISQQLGLVSTNTSTLQAVQPALLRQKDRLCSGPHPVLSKD